MVKLNAFNQVAENWRKENIELFSPRLEADVIAAFTNVNHKCSVDVIGLYCATGGMEDDEMDSKCFNLWSLEKVIEENKNQKHQDIAFADFLINSHWYYLRYEDENISSIYTDWSEGGKLVKIAHSVNDFFEIYLHNSEELGLF